MVWTFYAYFFLSLPRDAAPSAVSSSLFPCCGDRRTCPRVGGEPVYGGRILMGSIGEPSNLIPYLASDSASQEVAGLLYTAPLEYDKNLQIVKLAAEEWEVSEDGCFMRFKLREGLKWQDAPRLPLMT